LQNLLNFVAIKLTWISLSIQEDIKNQTNQGPAQVGIEFKRVGCI